MQPKPRPTGVTLLAILAILAGVFSLAFGVLLLTANAPASALLLVNGIVDFVLAIGYLGGSGWAWLLGIVFGAINIVGSIVEIVAGLSNNILGIIFSIVTIYYLTRLHIKVFFGKGFLRGSVTASTPLGSQMSKDLPLTMSSVARACKNCRATVPAGASFCHNCGTVQ